jgi:hypothetical protein
MNKEFRRKLTEDLKELSYPSETDAPFEVVPFENIREVKWNKFFAPLIKERPVMTREEAAMARRFRTLKGFIEANMKRRRVYKIGTVANEILIVGVDLSGDTIAIRTSAVETS